LITACFFACQNDVFVESELIAESRESCPIPECDVQIIKTESPGGKCCGFEIRAINMTDCALVFTVEERDGIQSIMVPIGGTYTHYLKLCDYNSSTIRFYNAKKKKKKKKKIAFVIVLVSNYLKFTEEI